LPAWTTRPGRKSRKSLETWASSARYKPDFQAVRNQLIQVIVAGISGG
jgi:hypothetical protein